MKWKYGGKSLAVGIIVSLLPDGIKKIVSPFFGGGSVEITCAKELNISVVGYDIFDLLVNFWNVQINNPKELANRLKKFEPTKEEYKRVKNIMKQYWDRKKIIADKCDLAAIYYFNHNTS
ncbi:MAG: DNA adenine methylase [Endomicrobium sp.]|nr:DNA adenine methylase [Endomicrobium sp.]